MFDDLVGIVPIVGRAGQKIDVLRWSDGKRAAEEGRDLESVCRGLTMEQLERWLGICKRTLFHEAGVIQKEIDRRDPLGVRETLWATVENT